MPLPRALSLLLVCACLGAAGCAAPQSPSDPAVEPETRETEAVDSQGSEGDAQAVMEAHEALVDAYERGDIEAFVNLLAPSPDLLIYHPFVEDRFDDIDEIRQKLGRMFGRFSERAWTDAHPSVVVNGDVAWVASHVLIKSPDLDSAFVGRGTEIWLRVPAGWRLVHGHWSEHAELAGAHRSKSD
jgi:ketosteroid isomerase-like protein